MLPPADRFRYAPPPPCLFGAGILAELPAEAAALTRGRRVAVVADPFLAGAGLLVATLDALAAGGLDPVLIADFAGEPGLAHARAAAEAARGAGLVVGIGGGAALDLAKVAAVCAAPEADPDPMRYALAAAPLPERLPLILVPTTAGTGAEASSTSVFSNAAGRKVWLWGPRMKPDLALLDPLLTATLPATLAAWCGLDALVHAAEAATNRNAHPGGALHALEALRLISGSLERAVASPDDLDARGAMLLGAFHAGAAIDNCSTALAHNISHALAGLAPVHHGLATALAYEATLPWLIESPGRAFDDVARACGLSRAAELPGWVSALMDRCRVERRLPEAFRRISAESIAREMAAPENAPMRAATARPVGDADLLRFAEAMRALAPSPVARAVP